MAKTKTTKQKTPARKSTKKKTAKKKAAPRKKTATRKRTSSSRRVPRIVSASKGITSIKVVGVGGGGGNAISRMMGGDRMRGVEFVAANTDAQDLDYALAHHKVYMGKALTRGLGSGMNPDVGKQAAEENRSEIGEILEGADVVFVTAGMGGGTGTGAAPIIAEIAREKGILTVGIVTKPFSFEGTQRSNLAQEGLLRLRDKVDALVVIPNDRIFSIIEKETSIAKAFSHVDDVLKNAVQGIAELINSPGIINVDFADIRAIMKDAGTTLIGIGVAQGQDRSQKAVGSAINSPLLESSIEGAKGVLFSIAGSADLKMAEINEVAKVISGSVDPAARIIFGAYHDRKLKEKRIKVTVIATGFNGSGGGIGSAPKFEVPSLFSKEDRKEKFFETSFEEEEEERKLPDIRDKEKKGEAPKKKEEKKRKVLSPEESLRKKKHSFEKTENSGRESSSWDIPAFLRRKKKK